MLDLIIICRAAAAVVESMADLIKCVFLRWRRAALTYCGGARRRRWSAAAEEEGKKNNTYIYRVENFLSDVYILETKESRGNRTLIKSHNARVYLSIIALRSEKYDALDPPYLSVCVARKVNLDCKSRRFTRFQPDRVCIADICTRVY